MCSHKRLHPSQSGVGQDHQRGTGGLASQLWTHTSVQTSRLTTSKGPSLGPRHGYAGHCCPYVCWEPHVGSSIREPPLLVLTTCCLKDNITPCKQAANRLQVLGQEQSGGGISVFIRGWTWWQYHMCVPHAFRVTGFQILSHSQNPEVKTQAFAILHASIINFSMNSPITNITTTTTDSSRYNAPTYLYLLDCMSDCVIKHR